MNVQGKDLRLMRAELVHNAIWAVERCLNRQHMKHPPTSEEWKAFVAQASDEGCIVYSWQLFGEGVEYDSAATYGVDLA